MDDDDVPDTERGTAERAGVLRLGLSISGLHLSDLWVGCISIDGSLSPARLEDGLAGDYALNDHDYNVVAQALNDRLVEIDLDHLVPYAGEI